MVLAQEQGASSWLTVLPNEEFGFALHKGAFHDALALQYNCMAYILHIHVDVVSSSLWSMPYLAQRVASLL